MLETHSAGPSSSSRGTGFAMHGVVLMLFALAATTAA
jgi:hypothetical protein